MTVESTIPLSQRTGESFPAPAAGEIDRLLAEIAALAQQPGSRSDFHAALLDRVILIVAAAGGAVWVRDDDGTIRTEVERLPPSDVNDSDSARTSRQWLIERLFAGGQSAVIPPADSERHSGTEANSTGWLLILSPITAADGVPVAAVEIFQRPDSPPPVRDGSRQILEDVCELAGDFHRRRELTALRDRAELWGRFDQFTQRIHAPLDLKRTAYTIVNEARSLIGCDRVCLLNHHNGRARILAVSGVDDANRRSNVVRSLEQLCEAVLKADEPLWMTDDPPELAPQIDRPLHHYLESSPARMLAVVPLKASRETSVDRTQRPGQQEPPAIIGALVTESFDQPAGPDMADRIGAVCGQSALALQNARKYNDRRGVFGPLRQRWHSSRAAAKTGIVVAVLVCVVAALALIPADFDVPARGELFPQERRDVYAPADGIVHLADRPNREKTDVRESDVLAVLKNLPLERQFDQVAGELRIVEEQLKAVRNARGNTRREDDAPPDTRQPLTAREQELEQQRAALQRQYEILQAQKTALTVRSPMNGQILTWDVVRRMETRPVLRGDVLMSVARMEGPWELELRLTQRDAGYLLDAQRGKKQPLTVQFTLLDTPGQSHAARVTRVSQAVQDEGNDQPYVIVTAVVDVASDAPLRPGATVTARIHCGRRSIGYVWFHDLIDTARSWWAL